MMKFLTVLWAILTVVFWVWGRMDGGDPTQFYFGQAVFGAAFLVFGVPCAIGLAVWWIKALFSPIGD